MIQKQLQAARATVAGMDCTKAGAGVEVSSQQQGVKQTEGSSR